MVSATTFVTARKRSSGARRTPFRPVVVACVLLMLSGSSLVRAVVIPNDRATTAGGPAFDGFLGDSPRTYQLLIDDSQLAGLSGATLVGITWRQLSTQTASWPLADMHFSSYQIRLGEGVEPSARSSVFAQNFIGPQVLVRSGPLTVPSISFPGNETVPCKFGYVVEFDAPYVYQGGNLVVELRDTGNGESFTLIESASRQWPGYGSQFSATWATGSLATSGTTANAVVTELVVLPEPTIALSYCAMLVWCGKRRWNG